MFLGPPFTVFIRMIKRRLLLILLLICFLGNSVGVYAATLPTIYKWDMRFVYGWPRNLQYDMMHMAVGLQGLANRQAPRVFLIFNDDDAAWLDRLVEPGGLCQGWSIQTINNIQDYVNRFSSYAQGVYLYAASPETGVDSTSLAATSAAAADDCIALRNDPSSGVYKTLVTNLTGPQLPIVKDLTGKFTGTGTIWETSLPSTGSAKCDAYYWLGENYIKQGKCDTTKIIYGMDLWGLKPEIPIDNALLRNLDYVFSGGAVCFELSPWGNEIPNDDPGQPLGTDLNTFRYLLDVCNQQNNYSKMIKFCGFPNWAYKYTTEVGGSHEPVPTEWETVRIVSAYNCYMEADALAALTNGSFYAGLKPALESRMYVQNSPPSYQDMVNQGYIDSSGNVVANNYIMIYMGDYDNTAWMLYWLGNDRFNDSERGNVACNWALNPSSIDRVGAAFDYFYRNKTDKDFFIAPDSGVGYVNPSQLYGSRYYSGYGDARQMYQKLCQDYYRTLDYSITGWLLNGYSGTLTSTDADIYVPFSCDGIGTNTGFSSVQLRDNVPVYKRYSLDLYSYNISASILGLHNGSGVNFNWYRGILLYPSNLKQVEDEIAALGWDYKLLDAYTFYYLLRYYNGGNNDYRATWLSHDIPPVLQTSQEYTASITVRNDGWDSWSEADMYRLAYVVVPAGQSVDIMDLNSNGRFYLGASEVVHTGQSCSFEVGIDIPASPGNYSIYFDMVRDAVTWFSSRNNILWKVDIVVVDDVMSVDSDGDFVPDVIEIENGLLPWHPDDGECGDIHSLVADISGENDIPDCYVNYYDLSRIADAWLTSDTLADISGPNGDRDGVVSLYDISVLAAEWMLCNNPDDVSCW